jgi:formylglycine-generating enzyme required for sulfatase activity
MVVVAAGGFEMGSASTETGRIGDEGPQHPVTISRAFAVGKFEVRFDEWMQCVASKACKVTPDEGWGRGPRPVVNVSWSDARRYVEWLAKKTGKPYRLLTEAEWEYVTRAGSSTPRYWDSMSENTCEFANVLGPDVKKKYKFDWDSFACNDGYSESAPVGMFRANAFGLHDTLGNVWEWVEDCYNNSYKDAPTDGTAWLAGDCKTRVIRGGGWHSVPNFVRSAFRIGNSPEIRNNVLGFRVARTLGP